MTVTRDDINTIDRAIAKGERVVRYADRTVEYRSIDELIKAKQAMLSALDKPGRSRISRVFHAGKGF